MSRILRIKLGDDDRAIYGCPEWMDLDLDRLPVQEAIELEDAGVDWLRQRDGVPLTDADGNPVVDEATKRSYVRFGPGVQRVWVWQALRRHGHRFPLADIDYDMDAAVILRPGPAESDGEPGKAEAGQGSPTGSTSNTPDSEPSIPD